MKTVLYKPIFINSQAYVVFPQLYELQPKYDNYLEYAVFSGRLIVKDVNDESDKLTFENTKQINLNHFIGATVEIDQYTESGNTVLGRWEIPSNLHSSLVDAWFMSGISNADNPSFVKGVKGNKLQLKNFAYALSSGFGKYEVDFTKYSKINVTFNSISIYKEAGIEMGRVMSTYDKLTDNVPSYSIEVKGLDSGYIQYFYRNSNGVINKVEILRDGIYNLPICYKEGSSDSSTGFIINSVNEIIITQLPSAYEGALVFDGVDDYGILEDKEPLTDFTVICRRYYAEKSNSATASCRTIPQDTGAFVFDMVDYSGKSRCMTYGNYIDINEIPTGDNVVAMTPTNYNGNILIKGKNTDNDVMLLGAGVFNTNTKNVSGYSVSAIYYFALYNKSLTAEEIEQEKVKLVKVWEDRL